MSEIRNKMKHFEEVEQMSPEIYYHYTTLDALYEIVSSKTFRLTGIKLTDSRRESFYKPEQFLADLEAVMESETKDADRRNFFRLIKESIEQNRDKFLRQCRVRRSLYALCLSEKKDGIAYWERYAANCRGVCIGFNVAKLKACLQRLEPWGLDDGLYDVGKAICPAEDREACIRNDLLRFYDCLYEKGGKNARQKNLEDLIRSNGYVYAAGMYLRLVKFADKDSFLDEYEVRLYQDSAYIKLMLPLIECMEAGTEAEEYRNLKKHFTEVIKSCKPEEEQFCVTKNGIRGYKELCLEEIWGAGTISEIILGPLCAQSSSELKRFLKANGLEGTKVSGSKVLMR